MLERWISHKCSRKLLLKSWAFDILGNRQNMTERSNNFFKRTQVLLLRKKEETTPALTNPPSLCRFSWNSQECKCCLPGSVSGKTAAGPEFPETLETLAQNPVSHNHVWISREKSSLTGGKLCTLMKMEITHRANETAFYFWQIRVVDCKSNAKG